MSSFLQSYCVGTFARRLSPFSNGCATHEPKPRRNERVEPTKTVVRVILIIATSAGADASAPDLKPSGSTGTAHNDPRAASVFNHTSSTIPHQLQWSTPSTNPHSSAVLTRSFNSARASFKSLSPAAAGHCRNILNVGFSFSTLPSGQSQSPLLFPQATSTRRYPPQRDRSTSTLASSVSPLQPETHISLSHHPAFQTPLLPMSTMDVSIHNNILVHKYNGSPAVHSPCCLFHQNSQILASDTAVSKQLPRSWILLVVGHNKSTMVWIHTVGRPLKTPTFPPHQVHHLLLDWITAVVFFSILSTSFLELRTIRSSCVAWEKVKKTLRECSDIGGDLASQKVCCVEYISRCIPPCFSSSFSFLLSRYAYSFQHILFETLILLIALRTQCLLLLSTTRLQAMAPACGATGGKRGLDRG